MQNLNPLKPSRRRALAWFLGVLCGGILAPKPALAQENQSRNSSSGYTLGNQGSGGIQYYFDSQGRLVKEVRWMGETPVQEICYEYQERERILSVPSV